MDWEKVARYLDDEGWRLRDKAEKAFSISAEARREMETRSSIFRTFAEALRFGLAPTP